MNGTFMKMHADAREQEFQAACRKVHYRKEGQKASGQRMSRITDVVRDISHSGIAAVAIGAVFTGFVAAMNAAA